MIQNEGEDPSGSSWYGTAVGDMRKVTVLRIGALRGLTEESTQEGRSANAKRERSVRDPTSWALECDGEACRQGGV